MKKSAKYQRHRFFEFYFRISALFPFVIEKIATQLMEIRFSAVRSPSEATPDEIEPLKTQTLTLVPKY